MRSLFLAIVVMTACKSSPPSAPDNKAPDKPAADPSGAVLEAVALHELKAVDKQKPVCLATRGADNAAVLAQIQKTYPNAVADSACSGGGPDGSSVKAPSGPGVRIDIGPVTVVSPASATCNGGGAYVSGGAREIQYIVELKDGHWTVTNEKVLAVM